MQLRVKPSAWITASGLSPACTLSTARIRISSNVLWSRARASRRFMPAIIPYVYLLMNILIKARRQAQSFAYDRNQHVNGHRNPNLGLHRILTGSVESGEDPDLTRLNSSHMSISY